MKRLVVILLFLNTLCVNLVSQPPAKSQTPTKEILIELKPESNSPQLNQPHNNQAPNLQALLAPQAPKQLPLHKQEDDEVFEDILHPLILFCVASLLW